MSNYNHPHFICTINDRSELLDARTYLLNKQRTIVLNNAIDEETAFYTASAIVFLSKKSNDDIVLHINCPGGAVSDGMAILDAMQATDCDIATQGTGTAASMGAFLLAGGTKGKRYCTPNTQVLLHQPLGGAQGQVSDIMLAARNMQKTKTQLVNHFAQFTGQTPKKIDADLDRDLWLSAHEALEYGIIDHVGDYK